MAQDMRMNDSISLLYFNFINKFYVKKEKTLNS